MLSLLIIVVLLLLYFYGKRNHHYWKNKGVAYEEPIAFFGNNLKKIFDRVSYTERYARMHQMYENEKYVGFYRGNTPAILIRDPNLIKDVLAANFKSFHFRGMNPSGEISEPLMNNIFTADGDTWRLSRQKLSAFFSSAKLKAMFPLIVERTVKLENVLEAAANDGEEVDVRELMARYATDFIGACGFGIDSDSLNDESSDFRKLGKRIVTFTSKDVLVALLKFTMPDIFKKLYFFDPEIERTIVSIIRQICEQRDNKPSNRNDFIDFMLELKQKEKIVGESMDKLNADGTPKIVEINVDEVLFAAQVFLFFLAGFETSSSASSFLLHKLAYLPEFQTRCQQEIDEVLEKYDGKITFDAVKEMKFVEMCLKETLRLYPSPGFLLRSCTKKYTFPSTGLTVDKGTGIVISLQGLHRDERYFDEPELFRPDRFDPVNEDKIKSYSFIPFGAGPRACIGERMGVMQTMAGVATILSKFTVVPSNNSVHEPRYCHKSSVFQNVIGGLPLNVIKRTPASNS